MVRVAIVEDKKEYSESLHVFTKKFFKENSVEFTVDIIENGLDLVKRYKSQYDVLLLDIEMPLLDGMEAAKRIRQIDDSVIIIFVTNMAQFAVNGYEVDAVSFLVKPISYFMLSVAMKKALNLLVHRKNTDIMITTKQNIRVVSSDDLLYVESFKNDLFYVTSKEKIQARGVLKNIESKLSGHNFSRCNNGLLVNLKYVTSINNNIVVVNHEELPISRGRKKEFVDDFMSYIGGVKNA